MPPRARPKRKIRLPIHLPEDLHARLKRAAEADDRPMASWVVAVVRRALDDFEAARRK